MDRNRPRTLRGADRRPVVDKASAAWRRAGTRLSCSPAGLLAGLAVIAAAFLASRDVTQHRAMIVHAAVCALAALLIGFAATLLYLAVRLVRGAEGRHTDVIPQAVPVTVPAPAAPLGTVPAPAAVPGSYTWRLTEPVPLPDGEPELENVS